MKVLGFILTSTPTSGEVIKLSSFRFTHSIQNTKMGFHKKKALSLNSVVLFMCLQGKTGHFIVRQTKKSKTVRCKQGKRGAVFLCCHFWYCDFSTLTYF